MHDGEMLVGYLPPLSTSVKVAEVKALVDILQRVLRDLAVATDVIVDDGAAPGLEDPCRLGKALIKLLVDVTERDTTEDNVIRAHVDDLLRKLGEGANEVINLVLGMGLGMLLRLINVLWSDIKANTMRPSVPCDPQASRPTPRSQVEDFVTSLDSCPLTHTLREVESGSRIVEHDIGSWTTGVGEMRVVAESHVTSAPQLVVVPSPSVVVDLCDLVI